MKTFREEHRLKVFEYRVLRRIFGSKRGGTYNAHGDLRNAYKIFVGKPEKKITRKI
jgi:hypothetical protein